MSFLHSPQSFITVALQESSLSRVAPLSSSLPASVTSAVVNSKAGFFLSKAASFLSHAFSMASEFFFLHSNQHLASFLHSPQSFITVSLQMAAGSGLGSGFLSHAFSMASAFFFLHSA